MSEQVNQSVAPELYRAAYAVHSQFVSGHHPTFEQLERLAAALGAARAKKICGHLMDEDCNCFESDPPPEPESEIQRENLGAISKEGE